jgi:hypothetical protein
MPISRCSSSAQVLLHSASGLRICSSTASCPSNGQAAQTAKRSPEFSATYAAIAKRRGKKIATIAISRKLLTRAYHLLAEAQAAQA